MSVPKLRFKADDGNDFSDWEKVKHGNILLEGRLGGNYENRADKTSKPLIKMGNIGRGSIVLEKIEYIPEETNINESDILKYGDLLFNTRNTLELVGKVAIWKNEINNAYYNSNLLRLKYNQEKIYDNFFMNYLFNSPYMIKELRKKATGTTSVAAIYTKDLDSIRFLIPSNKKEQQKIADFLSAIDTVIEKQQATVEAWEQRKKGVMQKLFNQEVRFKADDGSDFPDWEEKSVISLGNIVGGGTPSTKKKEYWSGEISWISSADVNENDIYNINMTRFITQEAIDNSATKIIPKNSILIVSRVGVGKVAKAPCDLCTSQDFTNIVNVKGDSTFLTYAVLKLMQSKAQWAQGTSIKGIPSDEIKNYMLKIPSLPEQLKIADCLSALDDVIKKQKETLEKWQELKKGLLQQMFV